MFRSNLILKEAVFAKGEAGPKKRGKGGHHDASIPFAGVTGFSGSDGREILELGLFTSGRFLKAEEHGRRKTSLNPGG